MTPEWYTQNAARAYPFVRGTVGRPGSGSLLNLPAPTVVDAGFVLGPKSQFDPAAHAVYLARVRRAGDTFYFDFESDAPELYGVPLTFARALADPPGAAEFADTGTAGASDSSLSYSADTCAEPLWSGFLATGDLAALAEALPTDGTLDRGAGGAVVEPALLQNLAGTVVTRVTVANDDRVRVTGADGCAELGWPFDLRPVYVYAPCLRGTVRFEAGYNATVRQAAAENALVFGAAVGAGAGEPCADAPRFPGEEPPAGRHLDGSPPCGGSLRSINGVGGRVLTLEAGPGVRITADPDANELVVDVDMSGLAVCVSRVSESC